VDQFFNVLLFLVVTAMSLAGAGHALMYKRDPRASLGWIAVCLLFPAVGPILYFFLGINRIRIRAGRLEAFAPFALSETEAVRTSDPAADAFVPPAFGPQARISRRLSGVPLVAGNSVKALFNGEQAYPEMIEAIKSARETCFLSTYIFESNETGRDFVDALAEAEYRGVDVRVIVDGVGEFYNLPHIGRLLKRKGVRFSRFLPPKLIPPQISINLRNHRKVLVVDGHLAFTGGMNIGDRHLVGEKAGRNPVADVQFRIEGPAVARIEEVFLWDWGYSTGEYTAPRQPRFDRPGKSACRCVTDGPNEELDKLTMIIAGAVNSARSSVRIMTPYFLPPRDIISALQSAALRGVDVRVVLPRKNNLPYVAWACRNMLWEVLKHGVRVYYQPPPFNHSKLLCVDGRYVQIGSHNIDPRSLRLNFELAMEIYDADLAGEICSHFDRVISESEETTLSEMDSRPMPVRIRDSLAWLFSPYL
jgi:cardiolipin synthase